MMTVGPADADHTLLSGEYEVENLKPSLTSLALCTTHRKEGSIPPQTVL